MSNLKWWGYIHTNGSIQVKRYFGDPMDLAEARESPFVHKVFGPFDASSRHEATDKIKEQYLKLDNKK